MRSLSGFRLLLFGAATLAALGPLSALAAPVKLVASLTGAGGGDPDGSGTFAVDADPDLGDFCYVLNLAKVGKVTAATVQSAASPDPLIKLEITGTNADECIAVEPSVIKPIIAAPGDHVVMIRTAEFPAGALQGVLARK